MIAKNSGKKILTITIAILAAMLFNGFLNWLVDPVLHIPLLFMDTVGTIAIAFAFGLVPGLTCALISQIFLGLINHYFSPIAYFYMLAVWGAVIIVCPFRIKLQNAKSIYSTIVILALISLVMTFVVSIIGGVVNTVNTIYSINHNLNPDASVQTRQLQADMIRMGFSQLPSNILSRIPGNLIERPLTTFMAYGICIGCKKIFSKKEK